MTKLTIRFKAHSIENMCTTVELNTNQPTEEDIKQATEKLKTSIWDRLWESLPQDQYPDTFVTVDEDSFTPHCLRNEDDVVLDTFNTQEEDKNVSK